MHDWSANTARLPDDAETLSEIALAHLDGLPLPSDLALTLLGRLAGGQLDTLPFNPSSECVRRALAILPGVLRRAGLSEFSPVADLTHAPPDLAASAVVLVELSDWADRIQPSDPLRADSRITVSWRESLAAVIAAQRCTAAMRPARGSQAMVICGAALQGVGALALASVFPRGYSRAADDPARPPDLASLERHVLGVDRFAAGRRLAERWRLDALWREVVWLHGLTPDSLPRGLASATTVALVHLAALVARRLNLRGGQIAMLRSEVDQAAAALGIAGESIDEIGERLEGEAVELHELLRAPTTLDAPARCVELERENAALRAQLAETSRAFDAAAASTRTSAAMADVLTSIGDPICHSGLAAALAVAAARVFARRAGAFVALESDRAVEAASACDGDAPLLRTVRMEDGRALAALATGGVAHRASAEALALWTRAFDLDACAELTVLPFCARGPALGGVVLDVPCETGSEMARHGTAGGDFLAYAAGLTQWVRGLAHVRRLVDDLAETNRCMQHAHAERLRSRALAMVAEMASGAGHELNTPLAVISGRAQLLRSELKDPQAVAALDTIAAKAHECSRIVTELMEIARPRPPRLAPVSVVELLRRVETHWRGQGDAVSRRISVEFAATGADGRVVRDSRSDQIRADADQIVAALCELISNAVDATAANEGLIRVSWGPRTVVDDGPGSARDRAFGRGAATPSAWVELCVSDRGCGMPPSVSERAFDPFYSHRRAGRSRGLGLARVHRTVEAHGGRVWIESQLHSGTSVYFILPAASESAERAE